MALTDLLTDTMKYEKGGRHGEKGYDFQRYWALCHLLQMDVEEDDFLLVMEFVEDVAILNSEHHPTHIDLIQLKKKPESTNWTKGGLINAAKEGKLSILGKLFASHRLFKEYNATIAFGSNAAISLDLASGEPSKNLDVFSAGDLTDALKQELVEALATQLGCESTDVSIQFLRFLKSHLALNDLETHAIGNVANYLSKNFPDHQCRPDILCKALYCELAVRASSTQDAASFEDLREMRGIGKSRFQKMLTSALNSKAPLDIVASIDTTLLAERVGWNERKKIKTAARRYLVDRAGKSNAFLDSLESEISILHGAVPETLTTSWQVAGWLYAQLSTAPRAAKALSIFEKPYVLAVILFVINK